MSKFNQDSGVCRTSATPMPEIRVGAEIGDLVSFDDWIEELGKTRATGWRWRKKFSWLKTVNIFGRLYVTRQTIAEFQKRALAGEFSLTIKLPEVRK